MAQSPAQASEPIFTRLDASTQDIVIEIRGDKKWPGLGLPELFGYGQILQALVVREIRLRYAQTLVGVGWVLLQPCLTMLILDFCDGKLDAEFRRRPPLRSFPLRGTSPLVLLLARVD